jgi:succinate dehydrogenase / fumarate reductase flavoprotein subunit
MGGIPADANGQVIADADGTPVVGFYAAGECACISVHGANRLGTNSLLGASVFGRRAGRAMAEFVKSGAQLQPATGNPAERQQKRIQHLMGDGSAKGESVSRIADELKSTMMQNCGVFRDEDRLKTALRDVKALQERFQNARIMDKSSRFNTDLLGALETEHLLTFSEVIVASGLARTESRGAHYRTDFRKRDDEDWLKHTVAHMTDDGPKLSYKSVNIDWEKYPPQERKY